MYPQLADASGERKDLQLPDAIIEVNDLQFPGATGETNDSKLSFPTDSSDSSAAKSLVKDVPGSSLETIEHAAKKVDKCASVK